jgi:CHASE2 domain-containing sensor protein
MQNSLHSEVERTMRGERVRHWLVVLSLTFLGLLLSELPVFSRTRDRVYLWLQKRLVQSQESVIVVAIDDDDFWRGEPGGHTPLDRAYLDKLLRRVINADPALIALDIGFETNTPRVRPQWSALTKVEQDFLTTVNSVAQRRPVVLPRTIAGDKTFARQHDLFEAIKFSDNARVRYGYTSSAYDPRQISTRVYVDGGEKLDSFAVAIIRKNSRKLRDNLEDPNQPWPYSFFLPNSAFVPKDAPVGRDGLLTTSSLHAASDAQLKKWLEGEIVLIGGSWRVTSHGGDFKDSHETPADNKLPGVVVQANYVQSLLWNAMYAMPRVWRLGIEISLALGISVVFLITHGWRRVVLVLGTLSAVVLATWVFSSAAGIFFDMVVPLLFLGVHAVWEGFSENFRLEFRQQFRYANATFSIAAVCAVVLTGFAFVRHETHAIERQLETENRLQVTEVVAPPAVPVDEMAPEPIRTASDTTPEVERTQQQRLRPPELKEAQKTIDVEPQSVPQPEEMQFDAQLQDIAMQHKLAQQAIQRDASEIMASEMARLQEQFRDESLTQTTQENQRVRLVGVESHSGGVFRSKELSFGVAIRHDPVMTTPTHTIAFAEPSGKCGAFLTDTLAAAVAATTDSRVVDRVQFNRILSTNGLLAPGLSSDLRTAALGVILGPASVVSVDVQECTRRTGREPIGIGGTDHAAFEAVLRASVKVTNLATRRTAVTPVHATTPVDPGARRLRQLAPAFETLGDKAQEELFADAAEQVQRLLFGWTETKQFPFFRDEECSLSSAFERLVVGDLEGAGREAQAALDACGSTARSIMSFTALARAHYNRGVTQLLVGDYDTALENFRQAENLDANAVFHDAVATCERIRSEARR